MADLYGGSPSASSGPLATIGDLAAGLRGGTAEGPALGGWSMLGSALAIDTLCASGIDWLCIDLQHGERHTSLGELLHAARAHRVPVIVRVPSVSSELIGHALDLGAVGVIAPMVETRGDAEELVRAVRYSPAGSRSWGPYRALLGDSGYTPSTANGHVLAFAMIESRAGVENVEDILSTPGLDGAFIGPTDLTVSLTGMLPAAAPKGVLQDSVRSVVAMANRFGLISGFVCATADEARDRAEEGFQLISVSSDFSLIGAGMRDQVEGLGWRHSL